MIPKASAYPYSLPLPLQVLSSTVSSLIPDFFHRCTARSHAITSFNGKEHRYSLFSSTHRKFCCIPESRRGSSMLLWPREQQRRIPLLFVVWNRLWNGMRNPVRFLHIRLPIWCSLFMWSIHFPKISSLEHVGYLLSPNATPLSSLPRAKAVHNFKSISHPRFVDFVGSRFIFLDNQADNPSILIPTDADNPPSWYRPK